MIYPKTILLATLVSLLSFTACGSESSTNQKKSDNETNSITTATESSQTATSTLIDIDVHCEEKQTPSTMQNYITTFTGDTIIKDTENTKISLFINSNNEKKVCLVNGSAHIIRE